MPSETHPTDATTGTTRPRSPDTGGGSERKRKRKVLSCYDCRRRKLQCDRSMPACGRCTKAGQAADCLYIDEPVEPPVTAANSGSQDVIYRSGPNEGHFGRSIQAAATSGDFLSRLEYQDRRIKQLETALAQASQRQSLEPAHRSAMYKLPLTPESASGGPPHEVGVGVNDRETILLRGRSFKTQYYGTTHPGGLISRLPELNVFTRETLESFPVLARIRQDIKTLEHRAPSAQGRVRLSSGEDLKALLPSREETDSQLRLYLDNYGAIYHVLHLPSFWKEYDSLWADMARARPHFVAIVLLMMAAAQCLVSSQPWLYVASSSTARERAFLYIEACSDWLETQSQKNVTEADFQIRFLILLATQVSARKFKRTWTNSGSVMRFFMSAGLHRDPDLLRKKTSILDMELRRRIWAAIAEMELQAAFDRGMVPAPWPQQTDCLGPSNIPDEDMDQDTEQLPVPRPAKKFTQSSYLAMAGESILLRHALTGILNNIRVVVSFDDAKRFTDEIQGHLCNIPDWSGDSSEVSSALLSLVLRQYLLVLHDRHTRHAETLSERHFSRMILIDTSTQIIQIHKKLVDKGCYALELFCQDHVRAALSICYVAATSDVHADRSLKTIIDHVAEPLMEDIFEMLTDKAIRLGCELKQLWISLATYGFWKAKLNPEHRLVYMQQAADRVTRPYYKIMACQEDGPAYSSGENSKGSAQLTNGILEYLPPVSANQQKDDIPVADPPLLDLDEIAAWTFADWSFDPTDLQQAFPESYQPLP